MDDRLTIHSSGNLDIHSDIHSRERVEAAVIVRVSEMS